MSFTLEYEQKFELGITKGGEIIRYIGYSQGEERNPLLSDPHGTNKWHIGLGKIEVILRNEEILRISDGVNLQVFLNVEIFPGIFTLNPDAEVYQDGALTLTYIPVYLCKTVFPQVGAFIPFATDGFELEFIDF